jgi:hypothetical protein
MRSRVFTISSAWIAMSVAGPSIPWGIEGWWIMKRALGVA